MLQIKSYKKKDGYTYYRFQTYLGLDETGKVIRAARQGFTSKAEARRVAMQLKADFQEQGYQKPSYETFEDIYELWYETIYVNDVRESTAVKTRELFDCHALKSFGNMRIASITPQQCQIAVNKWSKSLQKTKTLKNYCQKVFDYGIQMELMKNNPMERVHVPKYTKKKAAIDFYEKEELKLFLDAAKSEDDIQWYVIFRVLAFTGMRKGECLALQWKNVNFENKTITIDKTLTRGKDNTLIIQDTKTGAGLRTISVDDITLSILKDWRSKQLRDFLKLGINTNKPNQYVFTNWSNEFLQLTKVMAVMDRISKKADLKRITVHQLRHTHCSLLFEAGADIKEVQERLGHSSYEITLNIYTHVTEKAKEETAEKFASYIGF